MYYWFFAQGSISAEQAARALADAGYDKGTNWWLAFFLAIVTAGVIVLVIRIFRKNDANELLLRQANEDRLKIAQDLIHGELMGELQEIKTAINSMKEELIKFIYGRGGK